MAAHRADEDGDADTRSECLFCPNSMCWPKNVEHTASMCSVMTDLLLMRCRTSQHNEKSHIERSVHFRFADLACYACGRRSGKSLVSRRARVTPLGNGRNDLLRRIRSNFEIIGHEAPVTRSSLLAAAEMVPVPSCGEACLEPAERRDMGQPFK